MESEVEGKSVAEEDAQKSCSSLFFHGQSS